MPHAKGAKSAKDGVSRRLAEKLAMNYSKRKSSRNGLAAFFLGVRCALCVRPVRLVLLLVPSTGDWLGTMILVCYSR